MSRARRGAGAPGAGLLRAGLLTAWLLALAACGGETGNDGGSDRSDAAVTDAGAASDAGAVDTGPPPEPFFELGNNVTGKNTPAFYKAVPEGSELNVELGPQGLWMVVLAFKTQAMFTPPLFLSGAIEVQDHDTAGSLKLKKQKVFPGGDGFEYYYNFWLVVKKPDGGFPVGVAGKTGVITFEVSDAKGVTHKVVRTVKLTGGPQ